MDKTCKACGKTKPIEQFALQSSADTGKNFVKQNKYKAQCKDCVAAYAREWRKKNKNYKSTGKINQYPEEDRLLLSAISKRLTELKQRIKKFNKTPTDLDRDYLYQLYKKQDGKCPYSGLGLSLDPATHKTLSLDQIEPNKGYIRGNVQWVAWAINRAKGDMSEAMFIDMCRVVTAKCNDYPKGVRSSERKRTAPRNEGDDIVSPA